MSIKNIAIGIGDLFITRLLFDSNNLDHTICINIHIVREYRNNSEECIEFLKYITKKLFPSVTFIDNPHINIYHYIDYYNFNTQKDIKKYFDMSPVIKDDYIVFHTKVRIDTLNSNKELISKFATFCSQFKSRYTIVLIGDRKMSKNLETSVHSHRIFSVYESLCFLKNNNDVVDLTQEELLNTPSIQNFEYDIKVLANAKHVIGLGWGGNFSMTWAVTDKFVFYIDALQNKLFSLFNFNTQLHRDIDIFITYINDTLSI